MKDRFKIALIGALLLSVSFFILAFLNPNAAIDVQQHDVYFVFSIASFYNGIGWLLLLKVGFVFLVRSKVNSSDLLNWSLITDIGLAVFVIGLRYYFYHLTYGGIPRRYYRFDGFQSFSQFPNRILTSIVVLYLLNQFFFIVIISFSFIKKWK